MSSDNKRIFKFFINSILSFGLDLSNINCVSGKALLTFTSMFFTNSFALCTSLDFKDSLYICESNTSWGKFLLGLNAPANLSTTLSNLELLTAALSPPLAKDLTPLPTP